jgi:hypothetical protein
MQNLLVLSPDRITFDQWLRDFGMAFMNVQVSYVSVKKDFLGWGSNGTFWTRLPDANCPDPSPSKGYKYIDHLKIEKAVKDRIVSQRNYRPINF